MTGAPTDPYIVSITRRRRRRIGAEARLLDHGTTTYFGSFAGTIAANHDVS
jgi:hypothetical protein